MTAGYIYQMNTTSEEYHRVNDDVLTGGVPEELLVHAFGEAEDGKKYIIEVWSDEAAQERFGRERVMPALQKHGIDPEVDGSFTRFKVENLMGSAAR